MSKTLKVHRQHRQGMTWDFMLCGMRIEYDYHNYNIRVTRISDKVTCVNCKRIQVK